MIISFHTNTLLLVLLNSPKPRLYLLKYIFRLQIRRKSNLKPQKCLFSTEQTAFKIRRKMKRMIPRCSDVRLVAPPSEALFCLWTTKTHDVTQVWNMVGYQVTLQSFIRTRDDRVFYVPVMKWAFSGAPVRPSKILFVRNLIAWAAHFQLLLCRLL